MNELALFAGAGGGILGGKLLGWRTVCAVEIDSYCRKILLARQRDGILEPFPIWDDVRTFDGRQWRGSVDVISGGFPCQDISCAGKGAGINGERSGLWSQFTRIIGEVGPRYVFIENSPMLTLRGGDRVIADLAALGFSTRWGVVSAADAGAPHLRERIWIRAEVSDADCGRREEWPQFNGEQKRSEQQASFGNDANGFRDIVPYADGQSVERTTIAWSKCDQWRSEPGVGRVADGVAFRVDRLRALGNGQVPGVAALAWRVLGGGE